MTHELRAVEHQGVIQIWDLFTDGAWRGSRRLPRYLPIPLSLPLPLDCRQIVLMTTADCAIGHGAHERRLRRRATTHTDHADNSELEPDD